MPTSNSGVDLMEPVAGPPDQLDTVGRRVLLFERSVDLLIEKTKSEELWPELYARALEVLQSLPLTTGGFVVAGRRLDNALAYAADGEFGAAAFELRLLRGAAQTWN